LADYGTDTFQKDRTVQDTNSEPQYAAGAAKCAVTHKYKRTENNFIAKIGVQCEKLQ
jgi:hypothetical protein